MILLCGIPSEPPLALAIEAAERLQIEHVVVNQMRSNRCDIEVNIRNGQPTGTLWIDHRPWRLEDFSGAYTRLTAVETLPERVRTERALAFNELLNEWLELANCRVMNRAADMASNISKPYQIQLISKFFVVPPTLVTNDPDLVRDFISRHKRAIYKSVSSVRSIVREWNSADEANLHKIRVLPTQFQAFIEGRDIRVHVAGDRVFATDIHSQAIDYRYAGREGLDASLRAADLPAEIERKCLDLSRELRLPLCGIDLKLTPDGEYYCFECNPSPAYSYYQENSGQAIADALVTYLDEGEACRSLKTGRRFAEA